MCAHCNQETPKVQINGSDFCSVCGNRITTPAEVAAAAVAAAATSRQPVNLAVRRHPVAAGGRTGSGTPGTDRAQPAATGQPATPAPAAAVTPARHLPGSAGAMHRRVKPGSRIINLREAPVTPPAGSRIHPGSGPAHPAVVLAADFSALTPTTPAISNVKLSKHAAHGAGTSGHGAHEERLHRAKTVGRSRQISKWGINVAVVSQTPQTQPVNVTATSATGHAAARTTPRRPLPKLAIPALPNTAVTHHEALALLAAEDRAAALDVTTPGTPKLPPAYAPPPSSPSAPLWRPHLDRPPHHHGVFGRVAATTAAIAILAGYVWLQNAPKLSIQTAGSKAGVSASLPGYVPSSYSLTNTETSPGLVTLDFTSPSAAETLKITQHRTTWDSAALLDNHVATQSSDYATVQAQGLTIYIFGKNQAAWVNHGVWYAIDGASRLSREQILKIAYSL